MVVVSLANCPASLRGDLTKWLQEITTGIYVGNIPTRVREKLWEHIKATVKDGQCVMVFSTRNELGLDFLVYNTDWVPVDYDGIKLMMRPSSNYQRKKIYVKGREEGSNISKIRRAEFFHKHSIEQEKKELSTYTTIDIETTGLSENADQIIELGAIRVVKNEEIDSFQSSIQSIIPIMKRKTEIVGINPDSLQENGKGERQALIDFIRFIKADVLVAHNAPFDMKFLSSACSRNGMAMPTNTVFDTLSFARLVLPDIASYRLDTLASYLGIESEKHLLALDKCHITKLLFDKLKEKA